MVAAAVVSGATASSRLTFNSPPPLREAKAGLQAGVLTEHDGSITAAIRHQTKGPREGGEGEGQ